MKANSVRGIWSVCKSVSMCEGSGTFITCQSVCFSGGCCACVCVKWSISFTELSWAGLQFPWKISILNLIVTLCRLHCLFPSLCICVSTCSYPLSIKGCNGCSNGRWKKAHLAFRKGEVGGTDLCVSLCVSLLWFLLCLSVSSVWRTLTFKFVVLPCWLSQEKMVWSSQWKLKTGEPSLLGCAVCVCMSEYVCLWLKVPYFRVSPQCYSRPHNQHARSWTHRKHSRTLFYWKLNPDKGHISHNEFYFTHTNAHTYIT